MTPSCQALLDISQPYIVTYSMASPLTICVYTTGIHIVCVHQYTLFTNSITKHLSCLQLDLIKVMLSYSRLFMFLKSIPQR